MKKGLVVIGALALTACTAGFETDMNKAAQTRAENIMNRHQTAGCTFVRDAEDYKNCLVNTYHLNSPATYTTTTMNDGRPVAVITNTNKTPIQTPCGLQPIPQQETYEWAAPTTASETKTVETICQKQFQPQQTVIQTVEETIPPPTPEVILVQPEIQETQTLIVEETPSENLDTELLENTQVPPPPAPEEDLWIQAEEELTCPCEDPNDPCTHCYEK